MPAPDTSHALDHIVVVLFEKRSLDHVLGDSGEEYFHTNTQLFNILDDHNRFKIGDGVAAPCNAPPPAAAPAMDGFVTDYISTFTGETGHRARCTTRSTATPP